MSYDSEVLADAPIAYWKMIDAAGPLVDSISAYNLTLNNTPTLGDAGPILSVAGDRAVGFAKASTQYAQAAGNTTFAIGNVFTLEAWVKTNSKALTSDRRSIIANTGAAHTPALELGGQGGIGNRICLTTPGAFICETDDWAAPVGAWAHIVYVRTGASAGQQKIYVNGVNMPLRTDTSETYVDTAAAWAIGRRTNASQFWDGDIARVAIYNAALSQARVLAHLAAAKSAISPALSFAPPILTNPITLQATNPATDFNLAAGQDYIIQLPTGAALTPGVSGAIFINGGRNVVIIGGEVDISGVASPNETNARFLFVQNNTGTVYIEGVWVHGTSFTEGLDIFSAGTTYIQQNCRFDGLGPINGTIHPDLMYFSACAGVFVDCFTGDSQYQGISVVGDTGVVGAQTFRRCNVTQTAGNGPMVWQSTRANPTTLDRVYVNPGITRALASSVSPNSADPTFPAATSAADGSVTWPVPTNITGAVIPGISPYGDFVPLGVAGRGYVSQFTLQVVTSSSSSDVGVVGDAPGVPIKYKQMADGTFARVIYNVNTPGGGSDKVAVGDDARVIPRKYKDQKDGSWAVVTAGVNF
jgi:hypothetical protein